MNPQRIRLGDRSWLVEPDSDILQPLLGAEASLRDGDSAQAMRLLDRVWRLRPDCAYIVGPSYGQLFLDHARNPGAALAVLAQAESQDPRPDTAALSLRALIAASRLDAAVQRLNTALNRYALKVGGPLWHAAREVATSAGLGGWVGLDPGLRLVGAIQGTGRLEVHCADARVATPSCAKHRDGTHRFAVKLPRQLAGSLEVRRAGIALCGSGLAARPDFDLDGRASVHGHVLSGWVRVGWDPDREVVVQIEDAGRPPIRLATDPDTGGRSRQGFRVERRDLGPRLIISARLPDGRLEPLPDAPLLSRAAALTTAARRRPRAHHAATGSPARVTDIAIPVYLGREATQACLASVLSTHAGAGTVIVVDDASPDPQLSADLDALAAAGRIVLLRNPANLGFAGSVNRALAHSAGRDVVVLNADTVVHGDWLARVRAAAYSAPNIGTATPLSNDGSIASYVPGPAQVVDAPTAARLDRVAQRVNARQRVEVPSGVGFCLYLRRDCIDAVGELDTHCFGQGYGEETDWCLRAGHSGWRHVVAADVFVLHAGGLSFGRRRDALLERSQRLLDLRHPRFAGQVKRLLADDPLRGARQRIAAAQLTQHRREFVLLLSLAMHGGVHRVVEERAQALRADGKSVLMLRPQTHLRRDVVLTTDIEGVGEQRFAVPADLAPLRELLGALGIAHVEVHHFIGHDPRLIESVMGLQAPYDVHVHDYAWVCPQITLIDHTRRYCGEPQLAACERCLQRNGSNLGEEIDVRTLRRRSSRWLARARRVIVPSTDAARRLSRYFPRLQIAVEPLQAEPVVAMQAVAPRARRRIALIGSIGEHKGYNLLLACARDARLRKLPLEFSVVGHTENDAALLATGRVFITGPYADSEARALLRREQPHAIFLPSVWPETWSFTLTHALAMGVPILAFDLGAIAERLRALGTGTLLPLGMTPRALNDALLESADRATAENDGTPVTLRPEEPTAPRADDRNEMSNKTSVVGKAGPEDITATAKTVAAQPGMYLVSVRAGDPVASAVGRSVRLPALQVSVAPGIAADSVTFLPGPGVNGNWLAKPGDLLVARVQVASILLFTTVRAPGGAELAIRFERLDGRDAPAIAPPAAAPPPAPVEPRVGLSLKVATHVRARGDLEFVDVPWAGRLGRGLWIESFAVTPLDRFGAQDIEYKGLTASGFESPWLSNAAPCGTRGMAIPLVAFAIRLKAGAGGGDFDCEYSGYFQSGVVVGPLRNGTPCRSTVPNDPLEGMQVRIVRKSGTAVAAGAARAKPAAVTRKALAPGRPAPKPKPRRPTRSAPARPRKG